MAVQQQVMDKAFWRTMYLETMEKLIATERRLKEYEERERRELEELDRWSDEKEADFLLRAEVHSHAQGLCD
jgi:hypothetical protein